MLRLLGAALAMGIGLSVHAQNALPFRNPALPIDQRVTDLLKRLSDFEKIRFMTNTTPAVPRLGIPAYDYWNEALHGTIAPEASTVFPQAIGLAATWDVRLMRNVAAAISDEARAVFDEPGGPSGTQGAGLTMFAPNINIDRDPRWGRGQETYGEDPVLTTQMALAYIRGLQGDDPRYLKTIATPKHFAVHSGPEDLRYKFSANVSRYDLADTYFPAFKAAVQLGHAGAVMCSYNAIYGLPSCGNPWLLEETLRKDWGFRGYVISDDNALTTMFWYMGYAPGEAAATKIALSAGTDMSTGPEYLLLGVEYLAGKVKMGQIEKSLRRTLRARFQLGLFDPPELNPYSKIPIAVVDSPEHRELAKKAAEESIVMLKNDGILPLRNVPSIAVVGSHADTSSNILGSYSGKSSHVVTPLEGLRNRLRQARILTSNSNPLAAAQSADVTIVCLGLTPTDLNHPKPPDASDEGELTDRQQIELPKEQVELWKSLRAHGKKVVAVLFGGGSIAFSPDWADAVLQAWYPGEETGDALASLISGDVSPSGRLPVTFYPSTSSLPDFTDYDMRNGRTYRYFKGRPLYPFGFGLSYTKFNYTDLRPERTSILAGEDMKIQVDLQNTGGVTADEVTQVYLAPPEGPRVALKKFTRTSLRPGARRTLAFLLSKDDLMSVREDGRREIVPGRYRVWVGGHSPVGPNDPDLVKMDFSIIGNTVAEE